MSKLSVTRNQSLLALNDKNFVKTMTHANLRGEGTQEADTDVVIVYVSPSSELRQLARVTFSFVFFGSLFG